MWLTQSGETSAKSFARGLFSTALIMVVVPFGLALSGTTLQAQTIHIKLVDGRNGKPLAGRCIRVGVGDKSDLRRKWSGGDMRTDAAGVVTLRLVAGDAEVDTQDGQPGCGGTVLNDPALKYGNGISVRPFLAFCQPHGANYSWLSLEVFTTEEVLQHGVVTANTCGKAKASPKPGEIIFFVRPLSWWERLKE